MFNRKRLMYVKISLNAGEHIPLGFSMSAISSFKRVENKNYVSRGKDFMKKFCESLGECAIEATDFLKNERIAKLI